MSAQHITSCHVHPLHLLLILIHQHFSDLLEFPQCSKVHQLHNIPSNTIARDTPVLKVEKNTLAKANIPLTSQYTLVVGCLGRFFFGLCFVLRLAFWGVFVVWVFFKKKTQQKHFRSFQNSNLILNT